jgi:hypothetical protein
MRNLPGAARGLSGLLVLVVAISAAVWAPNRILDLLGPVAWCF